MNLGFQATAARLAALLVLLLLTACSASRIPPGPGPSEPALRDGALVMDDGAELPLRSWLPYEPDFPEPKAVLLALHGFNDYSRAFQQAGLAWARRGFATYAYDQRGFGKNEHAGLWAGTERMARDARVAARIIAAQHPGVPLYLVGSSMGAAVALVALAEPAAEAVSNDPAPPIAGVVLAAPAVWARETMPGYQRAALWLAARVIPWGRVTGSGLRIQATDNIPELRRLGLDPFVIKRTRVDAVDGLTDLMSAALEAGPRFEVPALLLYGEKDEIVPKGPTFRLWRELPTAAEDIQRRALYDEGWHMLLRDLQAETIYGDVEAWIADPTAPLPSGADRRAQDALDKAAAALEKAASEE